MGKWKRPLGTRQLIISLPTLAILIFIVLPVTLAMGLVDDIVGFLIFSVCATMVPVLVCYTMWGEVSDFTFKKFDEPSKRMIPRLEGALAAKGVPFAVRNRAKRSLFKLRIDEFLDLDRGAVTIALAPEGETTRVFLGPVGPDNGVVIERLKALVDGAVG